MLRLFLLFFGYLEYCCYVYLYIFFCVNIFSSLGYICRSGIVGSCDKLCFFEELPHCFPKWLYYFMFPPATREGSSSSSSFSAPVSFIKLQPFCGCVVVSHRDFDLHLPVSWACFHVLIGCLYAFFGQLPIQSLCLCFSWFVFFTDEF